MRHNLHSPIQMTSALNQWHQEACAATAHRRGCPHWTADLYTHECTHKHSLSWEKTLNGWKRILRSFYGLYIWTLPPVWDVIDCVCVWERVNDGFTRCCVVCSSMSFHKRRRCRKAAVVHATPLMLTLSTHALCFFSDIHITLVIHIKPTLECNNTCQSFNMQHTHRV